MGYDNAIKDQQRRRIEATLKCPKPGCEAENRPGSSLIDLDDDGQAYCGVCSHMWWPQLDTIAKGYFKS